jgi:hypothetical protein
MSLFAITFELKKPDRNYKPFWDALHLLGANQATESVWMLRHYGSAAQLCGFLSAWMDAKDPLLVTEVSNWAAKNPMIRINPN